MDHCCCYIGCKEIPKFICSCDGFNKAICDHHKPLHTGDGTHKIIGFSLDIPLRQPLKSYYSELRILSFLTEIQDSALGYANSMILQIQEQSNKLNTRIKQLKSLFIVSGANGFLNLDIKIKKYMHNSILPNIEQIFINHTKTSKEIENFFSVQLEFFTKPVVDNQNSVTEIVREPHSSLRPSADSGRTSIRTGNRTNSRPGNLVNPQLYDDLYAILSSSSNDVGLRVYNLFESTFSKILFTGINTFSYGGHACKIEQNVFIYYGGWKQMNPVAECYIVDIINGKAEKLPDGKPRCFAGCVIKNSKFFTFGGWCITREKSNESDVLDLVNYHWSTLPQLPNPTGRASATLTGNQIFIVGSGFNELFCYDDQQNMYSVIATLEAKEHKIIYDRWILFKDSENAWFIDENGGITPKKLKKSWKSIELQTCCAYKRQNYLYFVENKLNAVLRLLRFNTSELKVEII